MMLYELALLRRVSCLRRTIHHCSLNSRCQSSFDFKLEFHTQALDGVTSSSSVLQQLSPSVHTERPCNSGNSSPFQACAGQWRFKSTSDSVTAQVGVQLGGKQVVLETGELAMLADGACVARQGGTVVLATVVGSEVQEEGGDFLPLQVDFREQPAASGSMPRTPTRRERGGGTEREVLASRALDRALRPLFPPGYHYPVHVVATVLSSDGAADAEVLALNAASAALMLSNIPWAGPVGAVRVTGGAGALALHAGGAGQRSAGAGSSSSGEMDLLVACSSEGVVMVEMGAQQVPEDVVAEALQAAHKEVGEVIQAQWTLAAAAGRTKRAAVLAGASKEAEARVQAVAAPHVVPILRLGAKLTKSSRAAAIERAKAKVWALLKPSEAPPAVPGATPDPCQDLTYAQFLVSFDTAVSTLMRKLVIEEGRRPDGRAPHELRHITANPGYLPLQSAVHGSALFARGETQALCTATIGTDLDAVPVWTPGGMQMQRLLMHYASPPFATGDVDALREPSRREVGHGALALRALLPSMPAPPTPTTPTWPLSVLHGVATQGGPTSTAGQGTAAPEWPFVVRLHSQTLASNGSSSMAAVCGGTLAMAAAGVPATCRVAGISVGLLYEHACRPQGGSTAEQPPGMPVWSWPTSKGKYALLTDIAGMEDALGDMDFKVAGTDRGLTALQLDIKQPGVPVSLLVEALGAARTARLSLLATMSTALAAHTRRRGSTGPSTQTMQMSPDNVPLLRGERGAGVAALEQATGARLMVADTGLVHVYSPKPQALTGVQAAIAAVEGTDMKEGDVLTAKVVQVYDWGALLAMPNGTRHTLHISELSHTKMRDVSEVVREGDELRVKVLGRDLRGLVRLSRKALLPKPAEAAPPAATAPTKP